MAPAHWLPIFRQRLRSSTRPPALPAAMLLADFGTIDDASLLKEFEQRKTSSRRRRGLVAKLARRVSPTVRVHDLGLSTCEIGGRLVELSEARRRAAALLIYLVTRPSQSAARDQVMEDLWSEQPPQSALNSLHQTMFFLRRLLEPWQEDGLTSAYVRMDADVVLLNPELFQIDSVAFVRQATSLISARQAPTQGPGLLRLYRGTFAPEFEYEPWAEDWRTQVHSTFLRLADVASRELIQVGDIAEATDLLTHVTSMDPTALDLRGRLVQTMAMLGAKDAAAAQYRGLVTAYDREVGEPPPPFTDLVGEPPPM
jgi:DNA-binding SARP family transcriptional activator